MYLGIDNDRGISTVRKHPKDNGNKTTSIYCFFVNWESQLQEKERTRKRQHKKFKAYKKSFRKNIELKGVC